MTLYWSDETIELHLGDCRDVLPTLTEQPVACVTDPPYGETSASWDTWPVGWVDAVGAALPPDASLWCFGSARMFLAWRDDFAAWKYAQEQLWLKRAGSGPGRPDRLIKVHEWAYHWYRGRWSDLHHEWEREKYGSGNKSVNRGESNAVHQNGYGPRPPYVDDGRRQPRSVMHFVEAPSVRGKARHQDEKPLAAVMPLVRECTPPGGLVLDPFAGTGTTGLAARMTGRRAVLIEADEAMCEVAATRLGEVDLFATCDVKSGRTT